ncbi:MAG: rhodanese-like domain-containing protein [Desulfobulbaceae bacterium]|nr:rhodanese-like domain-containing protein [Desulfobulbaceae bacterium]
MKRIFALLVVVGLLFSTPASSGDKGSPAPAGKTAAPSAAPLSGPVFRTVTPQEAQAMIAQRKDLLVIDVRGPEELKEGFIAGSQLMPFWEIAKGQKTIPTGRPVLLVCAVGGRSLAVGQYLAQKNYPEVYNLQGGIDKWKRAGLPLQFP